MRSLLLAIMTLAAAPAMAEDNLKLSATDISVRTGLTFKVADAVVQKLLPAGWELNSPAAGPTKGFNLGIPLIDYVVVQVIIHAYIEFETPSKEFVLRFFNSKRPHFLDCIRP